MKKFCCRRRNVTKTKRKGTQKTPKRKTIALVKKIGEKKSFIVGQLQRQLSILLPLFLFATVTLLSLLSSLYYFKILLGVAPRLKYLHSLPTRRGTE